MIQQCGTLLNPFFQKTILKIHGLPLTSSHPLDLVVSLRTFVNTWRICQGSSCSNRNQSLSQSQTMGQGVLILQIQDHLVLSLSRTQVRMKATTTKEERGGESEAVLCYSSDKLVWLGLIMCITFCSSNISSCFGFSYKRIPSRICIVIATW